MSPTPKSDRKRGKSAPAPPPPIVAKPEPAAQGLPLDLQLGTALVALVLFVPPFLLAPGAKEAFRQPKLYASGWLALASLFALSWGVGRADRVDLTWLTRILRLPALRAVLPLLALSTLSLAWTAHPIQAKEGLFDLWIGTACLIGWSVALSKVWLERLLLALLVPASLLALFGILQYHDLWQPLTFFGLKGGQRLALTSFAGNPGDLGAYLVLPCLIAQRELLRRRGAALVGLALALILCLYGLALTQTLAALAAVAVGSALLWLLVLPRRRALALLGLGLVLGLGLAVGIAPLRSRLSGKLDQLRAGSYNDVFSGRFDGWQTALWMFCEHPLLGVGHGAYRPEFIPAKLALLDRGSRFSIEQTPVFANAHSEPLEVGAELGLLGLAALGWGLWVIAGRLHRADQAPEDLAFAAGGVIALAILSLVYFPFRVALIAFPALLFLAWVLRPDRAEPEEAR